MTLRDELLALDGAPMTGGGAVIVRNDGTRYSYLSGVPYLWTGYAERAYVFGTAAKTRAFLARHSGELGNATVAVRES